MGSQIVIVVHFECKGKDARDTLIERLSNVMRHAKEHETGTLKYCIAVPRNESGQSELFIIENYVDQAALDAHMAAPPVVEIMSFFESQSDSLLTAPIVLQTLEAAAGFTRGASLMRKEDPYLVYATLSYGAGDGSNNNREAALESWRKVEAVTEADEPLVYMYMVLKDTGKADVIHMLEAYDSEQYMWNVHTKTAVVQEKMEEEERLKSRDPEVFFLKIVDGFLSKESDKSVI